MQMFGASGVMQVVTMDEFGRGSELVADPFPKLVSLRNVESLRQNLRFSCNEYRAGMDSGKLGGGNDISTRVFLKRYC